MSEMRKIKDFFELNPSKNTNNYTDYINYIDTSSVTKGILYDITYLDGNFPSRANRCVKYDDILYSSVRPNLRHYYHYKLNYENVVASTGYVLLRNKNKELYSSKFLYYFLGTDSVVNYLSNIAELSQSTFPSFSAKDLGKIELPAFDFIDQEKIADILTTYDSLIENNNKRIKLLEQMAENLYKEWFVRFRFPGYEDTEFENGIPKGWEYTKLERLANISTGKCNREDAEEDGAYPLFDRSQEIKRSNVWLKDCEAIIVPGEGTSFIPRYYNGKFNLHQRCYCVEPLEKGMGFFLYQTLKMYRIYFLYVATGATVPSLRLNNFNDFKVLLPKKELCSQYNEMAEKMNDEILLLKNKNELLAKQRDMLLPRLMSGKLEV